jgi:multidrug efflux system outer membrane protein
VSKRSLIAAVLASSAAACAVGPDYEQPEVVVPAEFASISTSTIVQDAVHVTWWRLFDDPVLEDLIARAAASNLDLEVASARLREARALRWSSTLDLGPVAQASAGYTRTVLPQTTFQGASYDIRDREIYDAGFDATWELDVFGRLRRALEANDAVVGAALAARRDVTVSVLAEVARNYFDLRGAQAQLEVARRNLDNQRRTADLTLSRLEGGRGTDLDVARAQAQLHATRATLPVLEALVARAAHRIGVLLGDPPSFHVTRLDRPATLPDLPDLLTIGKPADLLARRPDIRIAERQLHSATARIGVARADYFPRLTLHGSIELNAARISAVGHGGAEAFSFGPRLTWAAFDLGHVIARETAAEERAAAAFAQYRRAVLLALEETENSLVGFSAERARRDALRDATRETVRAAALARERFNDGVADFLTVLDAERRLLEAQDALAASEARTLSNLVLVYKALGGGWEPFEPVEE